MKTVIKLILGLTVMIGGVAQASTITTLDFTGVTFVLGGSLGGTLSIDTGTGVANVSATFTNGSLVESFSGTPSTLSGTATSTSLGFGTFSSVFGILTLELPTTNLASYTGGPLITGGSSVFALGLGNDVFATGSLSAVPLPASAWLLLGGLGGLGLLARRRGVFLAQA